MGAAVQRLQRGRREPAPSPDKSKGLPVWESELSWIDLSWLLDTALWDEGGNPKSTGAPGSSLFSPEGISSGCCSFPKNGAPGLKGNAELIPRAQINRPSPLPP